MSDVIYNAVGAIGQGVEKPAGGDDGAVIDRLRQPEKAGSGLQGRQISLFLLHDPGRFGAELLGHGDGADGEVIVHRDHRSGIVVATGRTADFRLAEDGRY